ncbi:unnamed protein product, partial [Lymnaea stagnalis]
LPQSGKVTLLPLSTLKEIEVALKKQMKLKVKKEHGDSMGKESSRNDIFLSRVPILTQLEQTATFLDEGRDTNQKDSQNSKCLTPTVSSSVKQKLKLGSSSTFPLYQPSSMFVPSLPT